ncbi:MAG: phospho-N-acetylmuramoyl-pentapeptide-transferase [Nitrospirae bacterium]|jgi:phospho-N-acetylmuramoyl-pentapeptide-transferase|nr:phospho-N-acetylmuramoyl-pentapeptide-transferase [Nitrospirota bacterium]
MLYQLFHLHQEYPFFNIFRYITFRAIYATVTSMVLFLALGPWLIQWLRRVQIGQEVRDDGPKTHLVKQGTPTMGGVLILLGIFVSTLLWADLSDPYVWMVLVALGANGVIGFLDDYLKILKKQSKGLFAWQKFSLQILTGVLLSLWYLWVNQGDTRIIVPFLKELNPLLGILFLPFAVGVLSGTANAVNLTDGLDGLAIGPVIVVSLAFMGITYVTGHEVFARYLAIIPVPGAGELTIVCGAMVGSSLGFLWYNSYPASIFMGDVGALALGGGIGMMAIVTRQELLLLLLGGIFVAEAVSVIAQVLSFKIRKKRVLRMAPLHHHYELGGLEEPKVIVRFWIVSIILALLSLSTFKLR